MKNLTNEIRLILNKLDENGLIFRNISEVIKLIPIIGSIIEANTLGVIKDNKSIETLNNIQEQLDIAIKTKDGKRIIDLVVENKEFINKIKQSYPLCNNEIILSSGENLPVNNEILKDYRENVTESFESWRKRFVNIRTIENSKEIALYAIENDKNTKTQRKGFVQDLIKELINNNETNMIISGVAGLGKTTTLQYLMLSYIQSTVYIPIYIELKLITPNKSILEIINEKIKVSYLNLITLFEKGKFYLFFDGLNEILPTIKLKIYYEINELMKKYPKNFILISTRPQDYNNEFESVPVFSLQKMKKGQILDFINKNSNDNRTTEIIRSALKNKNWIRILGTPLIIFMLIKIVDIDKVIPNDESQIILRFIKNIYQREVSKDFNFDIIYFHTIICHLAFESIEIVGNTNSSFTIQQAHTLLLKLDSNLSLFKTSKFLSKGVELNILANEKELYSFNHQSYQETLAGDYFNSIYV